MQLCGYSDDQRTKFVEFKKEASKDENILAKHQSYLKQLKTEVREL